MVMIRNKISKENCSVFLHGKEDVHYDIVKVNLSLCLFKHHTMKTYGEVEA